MKVVLHPDRDALAQVLRRPLCLQLGIEDVLQQLGKSRKTPSQYTVISSSWRLASEDTSDGKRKEAYGVEVLLLFQGGLQHTRPDEVTRRDVWLMVRAVGK